MGAGAEAGTGAAGTGTGTPSTRVAAIDCGTNSIRLLVADIDPQTGTQTELTRRMEIVRLGQGVDATGRLAPEALVRTFAVCDQYADAIREFGASRVRFVATSATRDASNRDEFFSGVRARFGVEPEVITGDEEAALSFTGATRAVAGDGAGHPTPYLVIDIGGGSTEFVLGESSVEAARSVNIGCVRLTERHLTQDPPTASQIEAARRDIDAAIDLAAERVPIHEAKTLVGVAGSVTTVSAIALGLPEYDRSRVHLSRIPAEEVRRVSADLLAATHAQREANQVILPGRVDVIGAGSLILAQIVERLGLPEVIVSEHDILDGIALSLL
jgi:exopolyphosphatase/guanosine-5'-triphosphate,3'-diphosphate pyrophosphatase